MRAARLEKATYRPSALTEGLKECRSPSVPVRDTEISSVVPATRSRRNTSIDCVPASGVRFGEPLSNATKRPSGEMSGYWA